MIKNCIRQARQRRGATQAAIARAAGVPQSTYSQFETGRAIPDVDELGAICEALDTTPESLYPAPVLDAVYGYKTAEKEPPRRREFFSVKIPIDLAADIDASMAGNGYANRTEFCVDTVRQRVLKERATHGQ